MRTNVAPSLVLGAGLLSLVVGCGSGDPVDTSPPKPAATASRVDQATKRVESSAMNPAQKQAAETYLKQGAENAERMKASANKAASNPPR